MSVISFLENTPTIPICDPYGSDLRGPNSLEQI
jgi:hypothetical protein